MLKCLHIICQWLFQNWQVKQQGKNQIFFQKKTYFDQKTWVFSTITILVELYGKFATLTGKKTPNRAIRQNRAIEEFT